MPRSGLTPLAFAALLGLAASALAASAHAAAVPPPPALLFGNESAAAADAGGSLLFNPAALGLRYPSEFALSYAADAAGAPTWRAFANARTLGLAYEDPGHGASAFTLGSAAGGEVLRAGWATAWRRGVGGSHATDHRAGMLARPAPWLSLGAAADHVTEPRFAGARLRRTWDLALGLRPLALDRARAHTWGTRLTLTGDVRMLEDGAAAAARVRIGVEFEPLAGLVLRGAIEDHGGVQAGLALLGPRTGYHAQAAYDRDRRRRVTTHTVSLHAGEDLSAFGARAERRVAVIRAGGVLGDESLGGVSLLGGDSRTPAAPLHRALERALEDPLTRGVLLDLRGVGGMAQLEELRPRVARLRAAGKPVVAWLEYGGGRGDLFLASACDRIVASPEGSFAGLGLRVERRYYRRLLERWGIRLDRSSIGAYKSAYRNFSVDSTPAADREAIEHNLDLMQELFVASVARDRHLDRDRLRTLLDGRAWPPREVAKAGLIDSVGYREDALALLGGLAGLGPRPRTVRLSRAPAATREWRVPSPVAVVYAAGAIGEGRSGNDLLMGPFMGSETVGAQLERAFRDRRTKAVVFRVESPGGSVLASDLIRHAARRMKQETRKPLIVSMGGVAASGGYCISGPGDRIYADRFTVTGSIGVVFVKPSLEGWYARHDVRQDAFERGDAMAGWSPARDWDARAQASADSAIHDEYREFVARMAADRGLAVAHVDSVAQGRAWYGEDALARGLVDEIGGLEQAIAEARRRAGVPAGERIRLREYRRPAPGLLQRVIGDVMQGTLERYAHVPDFDQAYLWEDVELP